MSSRQEALIELIDPVLEALGCELWGLDILSQGRHSLLRIYIEKADGVGLEDCEKVSRQVSSLMDVEDPIAGQYTLEVSSPGMDRPLYKLEHYQQFIGEHVVIKLSRTFEKRKKIRGLLSAVEEDQIVVQVEDEEFVLPLEWIDKANLVPDFSK
ncbi:MAG: ribosome maturation factor RimP [Cellvibrionaceae bacterium]